MSQQKKKKTFMVACREFFGMKEGQSLLQFKEEIAALTEKDREEIKEGLEQNGYEIVAAGATS